MLKRCSSWFAARLFAGTCARWQVDFEREATLRMQAQDRVRELEAELRETKDRLLASQRETTHAVQCVADWLSQLQFGRRIYLGAPEISAQPEEPEIVAKPRQQGRALCDQLEREFYAGLAKQGDKVQ